MGLCCSRKICKKAPLSDDSEFPIFQDESLHFKASVATDEHVQPVEHIVELLYEFPRNRQNVFKQHEETASSTTDDRSRYSNHHSPILAILESPQCCSQQFGVETRKRFSNSYKDCATITTYAYQVSDISPYPENLTKLQLPWESLKSKTFVQELQTQSKMSLKEKHFGEIKSQSANKSAQNTDKRSYGSFNANNITTDCTSTNSKQTKNLPKPKDQTDDYTVLMDSHTYASRFVNMNGKAVYMLFKRPSQSLLHNFFKKISPNKQDEVKESHTNYYNIKKENIMKFFRHQESNTNQSHFTYKDKTLQIDFPEQSRGISKQFGLSDKGTIATQTTSINSIDLPSTSAAHQSYAVHYNSLPYQSSSLLIIPSKSFSEKDTTSKTKFPTYVYSNNTHSHLMVIEHNTDTDTKWVQKSKHSRKAKSPTITENMPSTIMGLLDLQVLQDAESQVSDTLEKGAHRKKLSSRKSRKKSVCDPSGKICNILEAKYKRKFKTMNELIQMPPKQLILFITSGELPKPAAILLPTQTKIKYKYFLKSLTSGI